MLKTIRFRFKVVYFVFILIFSSATISLIFLSSQNYLDSKHALLAYEQLGEHTKLIHLVQKERGLTAAHLYHQSHTPRDVLEETRSKTTEHIQILNKDDSTFWVKHL